MRRRRQQSPRSWPRTPSTSTPAHSATTCVPAWRRAASSTSSSSTIAVSGARPPAATVPAPPATTSAITPRPCPARDIRRGVYRAVCGAARRRAALAPTFGGRGQPSPSGAPCRPSQRSDYRAPPATDPGARLEEPVELDPLGQVVDHTDQAGEGALDVENQAAAPQVRSRPRHTHPARSVRLALQPAGEEQRTHCSGENVRGDCDADVRPTAPSGATWIASHAIATMLMPSPTSDAATAGTKRRNAWCANTSR